jgi:hypothetical protein
MFAMEVQDFQVFQHLSRYAVLLAPVIVVSFVEVEPIFKFSTLELYKILI